MYIKNQVFLVYGISKSGFSMASYVLKHGGRCYVFDEINIPKVEDSINELVEKGAIRIDLDYIEKNIDIFDTLILSPGIPINNHVAVLFKEKNKNVTGEFDFSFYLKEPTYIGVTGTNGKTTTVSLINNVLKEAEISNKLVGNIGLPISSCLDEIDSDDVVVCEVSSFQLETVKKFSPHIACVLNISPDHLERHFSMENYVFLKRKILSNLQSFDYAILNYDDNAVREFQKGIRAKVYYVSVYENTNGCFVKDNCIFFNNEKIIDINELPINGLHNIYNAMFCIVVCKILKIENDIIIKGLKDFKGVRHRIEFVSEIDGVRYYNDSKATNTDSTIKAIETMNRPTVLVLGGSEKGEKYTQLFKSIKDSLVKQVILTGASRFNMLKDAVEVGYSNLSVIPEFEYAIKFAIKFANSGDAVLLSPACASFDSFSNYEERGDKFISIVNGVNS